MFDRANFGSVVLGAGEPCMLVAEIGSNFNGSLELARQSIDAAVASGADAVKFQTYRAEEFVADRELTYSYQTLAGERITESQYDMFKRLELCSDWHQQLKQHAESLGACFLSSAADREAVDLLDRLAVVALKFASEDLINTPLLEYAAELERPVILSTGMASAREIDLAMAIFGRHRAQQRMVLLHCTSLYPTPFSSCNLNRIDALRSRYGIPVGFSDHSEGVTAALGAVAKGACLIEKHFTLDRALAGPDHKLSADPRMFSEMAQRIRELESQMGQNRVDYDPAEEQARIRFRRSIVAARDLEAGETLTREMLAYKRPGQGLKPYEADQLIGKRLQHDLPMNTPILTTDVV